MDDTKPALLIIMESADEVYTIRRILAFNNLTAEVAYSEIEGMEMFYRMYPDLVITDILSVLKNIKSSDHEISPAVPVFYLPKVDSIRDVIIGLSNGADDCIAKPLHPEEFNIRLRNILKKNAKKVTVTFESITLDVVNRCLVHNGKNIELTRKEFQILRQLIQGGTAILPWEVLYYRVYGYSEVVDRRSFDVYMSRIRRKLKGTGVTIRQLRGVGYGLKKL